MRIFYSTYHDFRITFTNSGRNQPDGNGWGLSSFCWSPKQEKWRTVPAAKLLKHTVPRIIWWSGSPKSGFPLLLYITCQKQRKADDRGVVVVTTTDDGRKNSYMEIELISTAGSYCTFLLHTSPFSTGRTGRIVYRKKPLPKSGNDDELGQNSKRSDRIKK
jgi:hypothetical protein